jgi:alkylation response protein AidB-like acyl-CoA dehydrogenase
VFDETIQYMKLRHQFNRPIGSFQALKHRAADLKVSLEMASALTRKATQDFASGNTGWETSAAQAKLLACDIFVAIAEECIQFHGGIGFTWEHDCHLYFKRAWLNQALNGGGDGYRARLTSTLLSRSLSEHRASAGEP